MGSEEVEKAKKSKSGLCRSIARAAFSHIGLSLIIIGYCCIGAALFEMLEKENEVLACIEAREEYIDMENETLFSLLNVVLSNPINSEAGDAQMLGVFESFRNNSFSIGYDGSWCEGYGETDGPMHEWTFAGGLFFSMTIITTIGYGHIAPKTQWGRIFCVAYAMLGIPLMLIFLANVGDLLADVFKYMYAKVICCGCFRSRKKKRDVTNVTMANEPDCQGSVNRCNQADGTNGAIPKVGSYQRVHNSPSCSPTTSTGSKLNTMSTEPTDTKSNGSDLKQRSTNPNPLNIKPLGCAEIADRCRTLRRSPTQSTEPLILDDESDYEDDEEEWEEINKTAVPLTVSLGIIGLYIVGGAVLFKYWEGWDTSQSAYFCFITLSTIGFGDVTPGRDFSDPTANAKLIMGTLYSLFGMAILSMCFTLMQEEMLAKFTWIGRKLGVIEKDEDDLEDKPQVTDFNNSNRNQSEC